MGISEESRVGIDCAVGKCLIGEGGIRIQCVLGENEFELHFLQAPFDFVALDRQKSKRMSAFLSISKLSLASLKNPSVLLPAALHCLWSSLHVYRAIHHKMNSRAVTDTLGNTVGVPTEETEYRKHGPIKFSDERCIADTILRVAKVRRKFS